MRRLLPLLLIVLAACQASTVTPDAPTIVTDSADSPSTGEPTAAHTPRPPQMPQPTPMPPLAPPLPSTNVYRGLLPEGAERVLGIGHIERTSLSPDKLLLAVSTSIGVIMLDAVTYEEVWSVLIPSSGTDVSWSPDSTRIVINEYVRVSVRDASTGSQLGSLRLPVDEGIGNHYFSSVSWPSRGTTLALSGSTGVLWDYAADQVILQVKQPELETHIFEWLPDGIHVIASAQAYQRTTEISVWNVSTGQPEFTVYGYHPAWNPEGTLLVVYSNQGDATVVDMASGSVLWKPDDGSVISPDWTRIAVPVDADTVAIMPFGKAKPTTALTTLNQVKYGRLEWSPDSTILAAITAQEVTLWDVQTGQRRCATDDVRLNTNALEVQPIRLRWLSEINMFTTILDSDPAISLWAIASCQRIESIPADSRHVVSIEHIHNTGTLLITGRVIRVWDRMTERLVFHLAGGGSERQEIRWSDDSTRLVTVQRQPSGNGETATHWNVETGEALEITDAPESELTPSAHPNSSPDGSMAIRPNDRFILEVYDTATGEPIRVLNEAVLYESDPSARFAWSPDGRVLVGNMISGLYFWDVATWQLIESRHNMNYGYSVAYSPDGQRLAVNVGSAVVIYPVP